METLKLEQILFSIHKLLQPVIGCCTTPLRQEVVEHTQNHLGPATRWINLAGDRRRVRYQPVLTNSLRYWSPARFLRR
jgi:hypothetical protein